MKKCTAARSLTAAMLGVAVPSGARKCVPSLTLIPQAHLFSLPKALDAKRIAGQGRSMSTTNLLPLDGYTVVSLEQAVAAPLATRHLADLGARVIKLERIGEGDFARNYDSAVKGLASHFVWLNRGKESVAVDLKNPEALAMVKRLIAGADVFVHNTAPGAAERLGLGIAELRSECPYLITAAITGYGTSGPHKHRKAYDMLIQAESGLVSVTGTPETATKTGIPASDIAAAHYTCQSILAALLRRERTGVGATLDISMLDATAEWLGHPMYMRLYAGKQIQRMGLSHASIAPYNAYPTKDGEVLIGIQNDRGWAALMNDVFERPEYVTDSRFETNIARVENRFECDAVVARESRKFTSEELEARLDKANVASAQLRDIQGLIDHPQLSERDRWRTIDSPVGELQALLPPMNFRDVELPTGRIPALGEDTEAVLTELGISAQDLQRLLNDGALGSQERHAPAEQDESASA